jgi:SAM-dependent methyltransferase
MIRFAQGRWGTNGHANLQFEVADARRLPFHQEFDLVVSFNALHWIAEQDQALGSIHSSLKVGGMAQLRFVPAGSRKSLEDVLKETRQSPKWASYFPRFHPPYLHLTPQEYSKLAEQAGLQVPSVHVSDKSLDFHRRSAFHAFATVTLWNGHTYCRKPKSHCLFTMCWTGMRLSWEKQIRSNSTRSISGYCAPEGGSNTLRSVVNPAL